MTSESRYLKLDYEKSIESKKHILESEIALIEIAKRISNFQILRREEMDTKLKIKSCLQEFKVKLNSIYSNFPEQERTIITSKEKKEIQTIRTERSISRDQPDFQNDIEEIQAKLARLK
jgi:hypothetical protein